MALRSAAAASPGAPAVEKTMPGESSSFTCLSSCTSWAVRVRPGTAPVAAARPRTSELISELLPTLGRPTMPTLMAVFSPRLRA